MSRYPVTVLGICIQQVRQHTLLEIVFDRGLTWSSTLLPQKKKKAPYLLRLALCHQWKILGHKRWIATPPVSSLFSWAVKSQLPHTE